MKILIAVATYNRPVITDLCLRNLQHVRGEDTKVVIYDDHSEAYDLDYLSKFSDDVIRFDSRRGIENSRARTLRDFLDKHVDFDLLYLTDNDAIHDPKFIKIIKNLFVNQEKSGLPVKPVGLFNSVFHKTRIKEEADQFYLYETCPGISMCLTRPMVQKIVTLLNKNPALESSYGWDMEWPKEIGLPFLIPKISYVEHFARDRFESGMHSSHSGVELENALVDFERDRAINPSPYLIQARPDIIKEILGEWRPSEKKVSTLTANALKAIKEKELQLASNLLLQARKLEPLNPNTLRFLSVVAALQFDYTKSLELIDETIKLVPDYAVAHSNRGNILKELGRYEEALVALDLAIGLEASYAEAYMNKGNVLQELAHYADAIVWFDKAIEIQSNYAEAYSNKGNALMLLGRYHEAVQCFDQAIAINPGYVDAYWHKGLTQLITGDYLNGLQNYEARWFKTNGLKLQHTDIPRLENLENLAGKKVLIWTEQGLGDALQFCRYIKLLADRGALITFTVALPLLQLLNPFQSFCTIAPSDYKIHPGQFDLQSPLLSLPLIFGTTLETIPVDIPYLKPSEERSIKFSTSEGNRLKVGLIWNGGFRAHSPELWAVNKRRNIELEQIAKLKDVQNVDFYSLQKGEPAESELRDSKDQLWPNLIDCAALLENFSDTAALMANLDLIISVDTSSAHLAGALGKPVWILNRYDSCWRWLKDRDDSPWYPTAKIYQQKSPGEWEDVISRVKVDLTLLAKQEKLKG